MRLTILTLFFSLFGFCHATWATTSTDELNTIGNQFMSTLLKGDTEQAYKDILPIVGSDMDRFNQQGKAISSYMSKVREQIGQPISYDLISTHRIKEHFYKQKYLLKFNNAAIVWEINYYQPTNGWKVVDIAHNTDIDALFEN